MSLEIDLNLYPYLPSFHDSLALLPHRSAAPPLRRSVLWKCLVPCRTAAGSGARRAETRRNRAVTEAEQSGNEVEQSGN